MIRYLELAPHLRPHVHPRALGDGGVGGEQPRLPRDDLRAPTHT